LSQNGFRVLEASSIFEALEAIAKHQVGTVVLDINLPDGEGYELIERVREQQKSYPFMQFVIISAHVTTEGAIRAMRLSISELLTKPFKPVDFREAVQRASSRERLLRKNAAIENSALESLIYVKSQADTAVDRLTHHLSTAIINKRDLKQQCVANPIRQLKTVKPEIALLNVLCREFSVLVSISAWHMLLTIYEAYLKNAPVTVKGIAAACDVPLSSALRKLAEMEKSNLIVRKGDPNDARRTFVHLSEQGLDQIQAYFFMAEDFHAVAKCTG
jgi:two-component system chemotaxis response regulator CheY